jgi:hypothetical protein
MSETPLIACPVCASPALRCEDAPGWGEWRRCSVCTLEFVHPLVLPERPEALFESAYQGNRQESRMAEYHERLAKRQIFSPDPSLWFWTPAYQMVIDWLKRRVESGGTTLEIGCALGFLLHTLRREGFNPVGLDVAKTAVELNRRDGFQVWHGELGTMPPDWVRPSAVLAFFMLHHPVDPLGLLRMVRQRWPEAPVAIVQYGHNNVKHGGVYSSPPRTLFRWNARSLATLFVEAGYRPEVTDLVSTGTEASLFDPLRRVLDWTVRVPPLHRLRTRLANRVLPLLLRGGRQAEWVLVALGEPSVPAGVESTVVAI